MKVVSLLRGVCRGRENETSERSDKEKSVKTNWWTSGDVERREMMDADEDDFLVGRSL